LEVTRREVREKIKIKNVIVGDSHSEGCAAEVTHNIGKTFEVTGYVRPEMGLEVSISIARKNSDGLRKEDMVVVWGRANNSAKNESRVLYTFKNFVKQRKHIPTSASSQTIQDTSS
jgi:hypothetical protein